MSLIFFLITLCLPTFLSAETILQYEIYYGPLKIGESKIVLNHKEATAVAFTTGPGNILYPYQAKWQTLMDERGYPTKTFIYSKDRFKVREKNLIFYPEKKQVHYIQTHPSKKEKIYNIPFPLFDELTAFIFSWHLNYTENSHFKLPLFIRGERHFAELKFQKIVPYKFNNTTINCLQIQTHLPEASELLKRAKEILLLLHKEEKIPLEIRGTLPILGSLTAKLKSYTKN